MVKTELIMKRIALIAIMSLFGLCAVGQEYGWHHVEMDGSRTGTASASKDNVPEAVGTIRGNKYIAPNGQTFKKRSIVGKTARIVLDAQPAMARVKDVVGYSTEAMEVSYPESALSNWFIDIIMARTEELMGKEVHVGIGNFGGIRIDMPQGVIILDDMLSMFPFKNQLVYVEHTGKQLRSILENMAQRRFEVLGGFRVVAEDGKLVSAEIGGEPIEDDKVYGLATISFLLNGGDGLKLAENAISVTVFENEDIIDAVLAYVKAETAAGRPIEYKKDGRVTIKGDRRRK